MKQAVLIHLLFVQWAAWCLVGCGFQTASRQHAHRPEAAGRRVVVFAAASTSNALDEISRQFGRKRRTSVKINYAGSSMLAQQIEMGAGADVFLSAAEQWADYLERSGRVAQRRDLLANRMVIVVPLGGSVKVETPQDLLSPQVKHLALADPGAVPAGVYARQALLRLGLWEQLRAKVVAGPDVRHALSYVETGAAEAGMVYATDAAISHKVQVAAELDPHLTGPIRYPVVLLHQGADNPAARSFFRYLSSSEAVEVFQKYGFTVLADAAGCAP